MLINPHIRFGADTNGENGREIKKKSPIKHENNPKIAPMVLYSKKLNDTDRIAINKDSNRKKDTNRAKDIIF